MASPFKKILVTGGAGFIGSALIRHLIANSPHKVLNVDALTYAGGLSSLVAVAGSSRYAFTQADICDQPRLAEIIARYRPDVITHLAAETHVDRSIDDPSVFIQTNLVGTFSLLGAVLDYWRGLASNDQARFRFHHISTDEVFGTLGPDGLFGEDTAYDPRSPYSATKAGSDHLVRAWHHTYGLPAIITNCSNNYGPFQFPEKLIPSTIVKCLAGDAVPVYGKGDNVRDWLHVDDHARALQAVFERGAVGETYLIGGRCERTSLCIVNAICDVLDRVRRLGEGVSYRQQIAFVADRPGHDYRYAIDPSRIEKQLNWRPLIDFDSGLEKTIRWYVDNQGWCRSRLAQ